eukprot:scpid52542/ scgid34432/ Pyridoxal phosphate phosphatase PHOSPHO2
MTAAAEACHRTLVVFDFDRSLLEDDTDRWSMKLGGDEAAALRASRGRDDCWTDLMGEIFAVIHSKGVGREQFEAHMQDMVIHTDMLAACKLLEGRTDVDCFILSDSNSVFIDVLLERYGLKNLFKRVVTNPAHFDKNGCLRIQHCHSHSCATCVLNLCKAEFMSEFIATTPYARKVYIGDGGGDLHAALQLSPGDTLLARRGYPLMKKLATPAGQDFKANLVPWDSGTDVLSWFQKHLSS